MSEDHIAASALALHWVSIAEALGIRVIAPASVVLPSGTQIHVDVLLPDFGAERGMLLVTDDEVVWPHRAALVDAGYGFSVLSGPSANIDASTAADEALEPLRDWGWTGDPARKPQWMRDE